MQNAYAAITALYTNDEGLPRWCSSRTYQLADARTLREMAEDAKADAKRLFWDNGGKHTEESRYLFRFFLRFELPGRGLYIWGGYANCANYGLHDRFVRRLAHVIGIGQPVLHTRIEQLGQLVLVETEAELSSERT